MSNTEKAKRIKTLPTSCGWVFAAIPLALAVSCGDAPTRFVVIPGGSGGTGGSSGTGGMAGVGGAAGMAGMAGTGGMVGTGGVGGSGASAGTGGSAGTGATGGASGACVTNALCHTCPSDALPAALLCDTNNDCFPGYLCVPSGCETHGGAPIGQCQALASGSCTNDSDCPNVDDYDCQQVGAGGSRCMRVTAGCDPATETYDCAPGFSCNESGVCEDHRAPCDDTLDCPKSHICHAGIPTGSFCLPVYRTCHADDDCRWSGVTLGKCDNVDGDGGNTMECSGQLMGSDAACVNTMCPGSPPVCENGVFGTGTTAVCGDYGLCRTGTDCSSGFDCIGVGQDGRKECVESPGDCESATDCPPQQVCAAPRDGGSPSCQVGKEAM